MKMPYHKEAPPKRGFTSAYAEKNAGRQAVRKYLYTCGEDLKPCALSTLEVVTSSPCTKATAGSGNQPIRGAVLFAAMGKGVLGVCLAVVFAPLLTWENVRGPLVRVGGGCRREHYNQGCQRGHYKFLTETHHETMMSHSGSHPENLT